MIAKTDFEYGDAGALVDYIKRDGGERVPVRDSLGRELDGEDLQRFVDASEWYGIERHLIVAPDPEADYTPAEIDDNIRTLMNEWQRDRPTIQYVYTVHEGRSVPHAHVAATGQEYSLHMDTEDLRQFRETARRAFKEPERLAEREAVPEAEKTATHGHGRLVSRSGGVRDPPTADPSGDDADPRRGATVDAEAELERDLDLERGGDR